MRRYRLLGFSIFGIVAVLLGLLVFGNLNRNLVYYLTPAEAIARHAEFPEDRRFQVGGLVKPDTVTQISGGLRFVLSSGTAPDSPSIKVVHHGAPAQLFQAGIGVILEGAWRGSEFVSDTMIVKHDENYRPPAENAAQGRTAGGP